MNNRFKMDQATSQESSQTTFISKNPIGFLKRNVFATLFIVVVILVTAAMIQYIRKTPSLQSKPQPGSCQILEEQYCVKAEFIERKNSQGQEIRSVGFHLPAGTPLFAPIKGDVAKSEIKQPSIFKGFVAVVRNVQDDKNANYIFRGDIVFNNMNTVSIEKGEIIGKIGNTGATNFDKKYELVLDISQLDQVANKLISANQVLLQLFPKIKQ